MALGKTKEARLDFRTVVRIKPSDKDAQNKLKECEKAIYAAAFSKAIEGEKRPLASLSVVENVKNMTVEDSQYTCCREGRGMQSASLTDASAWSRCVRSYRSCLSLY